MIEEIEKLYGVKLKLEGKVIELRGKKYWLFNEEILKLNLPPKIIVSYGIYLGKFYKGKFKPSLELAMMLKDAKRRVAWVDDWREFMKGEAKPKKVIAEEGDIVIVKWDEDVIGVAEYRDGKLKNLISKGRRLKKFE